MWVCLFPSSQVRIESGRVENSTGETRCCVGLACRAQGQGRVRGRVGFEERHREREIDDGGG